MTGLKTVAELVKSDVAEGATNTARPLTRLLDDTERGLAVKATSTCSAYDCERQPVARGMCNTHWKRWRATISVLPPSPRALYAEAGCGMQGCSSPLHAGGLCGKHYKHSRYPRQYKPTVEERFRAKVDVRGPDDCWHWTAHLMHGGYGMFYNGTTGTVIAHRFAYELVHGPIAAGLHIDHTCHNGTDCEGGDSCAHRRCCNPKHLEAVSPAENHRRSHRAGGRTHCPNGHEYAGNVYNFARGKRCKPCHLAKSRQARGLPDRRIKYDPVLRDQLVADVKDRRITRAQAADKLGCARKYMDKLVRLSSAQ